MAIDLRALGIIAALAWMLSALPAAAGQVLVIETPPYAVQDESGNWSGPAVDLFRAAADAAGRDYTLSSQESAATGSGAAVAFPLYASSQSTAPQSLPFHVDAVGLIGASEQGGFIDGLLNLFSFAVLRVLAVICAMLLVVGALFWLLERRENDSLAGEHGRIRGIGDGFWWAGVTATTIGYGDLVPRTVPGRILAMVWMLFAMALTAVLTAYLVSLTGQGGGTTELRDAIAGKRVAYVTDGPVLREDLANAEALSAHASLPSAIAALDAEQVDVIAFPYQPAKAAAGDRPVQRTGGSTVMPVFVVPGDEAMLRELNRVILSPKWQARIEDRFER